MNPSFTDTTVLKHLKHLRGLGRTRVRAGEIARRFGVDSVRALGALERVKRRLWEEEARSKKQEARS